MIRFSKNSWLDRILITLVYVDLVMILLNYLSYYLKIEWIPAPGRRLNNPIGILIIVLVAYGALVPKFRQRWLGRLQSLVTGAPARFWFFLALLTGVVFLELMHMLNLPGTSGYSKFWDLNVEKGYATYFSTFQLFALALVAYIITQKEKSAGASKWNYGQWAFSAFMFLFLCLDEVIGIHDILGFWMGKYFSDSKVYQSIYAWLWYYAPFIVAGAIFLLKFFLRISKGSWMVKSSLLGGLSLWVFSIFMEAIAKQQFFARHTMYIFEEGAEMLGATLILLGLSEVLRLRTQAPVPHGNPAGSKTGLKQPSPRLPDPTSN